MDEEIEEKEGRRAQALRQARAQNIGEKAGKKKPVSEEEVERLEKLVANKDKTAEFVFMGILASIGSTLGAVPFIGWLISLGTAGGISLIISLSFEGNVKRKTQWLNVGGVVGNLIAAAFGVDAIPEQALTVILTVIIVNRAAHKAKKKLEKMGHE